MIHVYRCENPKRTRTTCPFHKKLEYAEIQDYYDGRRIFFDCGTWTCDGYYYAPTTYKRLEIFWDSERGRYAIYVPYAGIIIAGKANLASTKRIANSRLKKGGTITLKD